VRARAKLFKFFSSFLFVCLLPSDFKYQVCCVWCRKIKKRQLETILPNFVRPVLAFNADDSHYAPARNRSGFFFIIIIFLIIMVCPELMVQIPLAKRTQFVFLAL